MKLKDRLNRIPRPVRAIINLILVLLLSAVYYISIDCPTLSFTQEFRRAEKAHMIGRSEIVDYITDYDDFDKMLIAETQYGVCFFGRYEVITGHSNGRNKTENLYNLTYYEKQDDITVAVAPNIYGIFWRFAGCELPIYIFDAYPQAVRAEIVTTVSGTHRYNQDGQSFSKSFQETFTSETRRNEDGYFRFTLTSEDEDSARALGLLSSIASGNLFLSDENQNTVIPFTVRLYDANGELIFEENIMMGADTQDSSAE